MTGHGAPVIHDPSDNTLARTPDLTPERSLIAAVLQDAVDVLRKPVGKKQEEIWKETYRWLTDLDDNPLFSFLNICYVLGYEPSFLQRAILESIPAHLMSFVHTAQ